MQTTFISNIIQIQVILVFIAFSCLYFKELKYFLFKSFVFTALAMLLLNLFITYFTTIVNDQIVLVLELIKQLSLVITITFFLFGIYSLLVMFSESLLYNGNFKKLLLFSLLSGGFYHIFWFVRKFSSLQVTKSQSLILVFFTFSKISSMLLIDDLLNNNTPTIFLPLFILLAIVLYVINIINCRKILQERYSIDFSTIFILLFGTFYLQYKIDKSKTNEL